MPSRFRCGGDFSTLRVVSDLTWLAVGYSLGLAVLFLALWLYYDRRDHARFEDERRKTTFHCVKCDHIYAVTGEQAVARCPRCTHENGRLRF